MSIRLAAAARRRAQALKAELRKIERPAKEAARKERQVARKDRTKRIGKTAAGQRQERERDSGYLAWLRRLPCVACMVVGGHCGPTEAAHLRYSDAKRGRINPGMGRKPSDRFATPLGHGHHQHDQHKRQEAAFWAGLGIEPGDLTEALYAAYQAGGDGLAVLKQFTGSRR